MPKRSYPFTESFSSQYKIHIGQKELNFHGVFGNKYRQEVYEKTKNLLFNGTKAVMGRIWKVGAEGTCSDVGPRNHSEVPPPASQMLLKGQTRISLDGKLKKVETVTETANSSAVCWACRRTLGVSRRCERCERCERSTCTTCTRQCSSCSSLCCSVCTVTDYTERYDRVLCSSCSS
ncbi:apoptosis regulatory protein Siva [Brachyhypopomus gauderio]|uniref:apoptosis regulatory protein Siva n=1 Tax=Brachyhypopomus gauderio TaxID=698409 RepID=UPI004042C0FB